MKIAVTGATGKLGGHVINHLLAQGISSKEIYAIVRNPNNAQGLKDKGIQVVYGDYNKPDSLTQALYGIDKLLLISSNNVGMRFIEHKAVIEAAKIAKIKFIAYTSILNAQLSKLELAKEHAATEELIFNSAIPYTILRNGWYTENHLEQIPSILQTGVILAAAENGMFSSAPRESYAKAAAKILVNSSDAKKIYELAGDKPFTLTQLAQNISIVTSLDIKYINLSKEEYSKKLISFNIPEAFANILADSDEKASQGELFSNSRDLELLNNEQIEDLATLIKKYL